MKKLKATVTKKDGTTKEVYVIVDNQTAEMLASLDDKKMVNDYLVEEYKMFMADRHEHFHTQSLDKSLDNGFDIVDEKQDLLQQIIENESKDKIHNAISKLERQQQELVFQIFFEDRKQIEIAKENGVGESAIRSRLAKIYEKLKKFLN